MNAKSFEGKQGQPGILVLVDSGMYRPGGEEERTKVWEVYMGRYKRPDSKEIIAGERIIRIFEEKTGRKKTPA